MATSNVTEIIQTVEICPFYVICPPRKQLLNLHYSVKIMMAAIMNKVY